VADDHQHDRASLTQAAIKHPDGMINSTVAVGRRILLDASDLQEHRPSAGKL